MRSWTKGWREEGRRICELLERNKSVLDEMCVELDQMNENTKLLIEEQGRKAWVNC